MGAAVFPPYSLDSSQTTVGIMVTSSKRTYISKPRLSGLLLSAGFSIPDLIAGHCKPMPLLETAKYSQVSLA